ncbi:MAG: hypothetical protein JHC31_01085 [Sulfurihydrogenibium sp.]|jgi:predicted membrane GTPase involved in stress response|nr:hypothetical protein [Sulfurihydrogenibium sp.]
MLLEEKKAPKAVREDIRNITIIALVDHGKTTIIYHCLNKVVLSEKMKK